MVNASYEVVNTCLRLIDQYPLRCKLTERDVFSLMNYPGMPVAKAMNQIFLNSEFEDEIICSASLEAG